MKCDWPWCQNEAVVDDDGEPLLINGMRVCKRDLAVWMELYHYDLAKDLIEAPDAPEHVPDRDSTS